ncbi:MAG TPA: BON domain-containing protein [Vicinamibacterales bacterium]|jgi:osmotically-inducible protein OsmY
MRTLLRLVLALVVLIAAAGFLLGWWGGRGYIVNRPAVVGTSGHVDTEHAREVGARIGQDTAVAAQRAKDVLSDAGLTAKIKSKMALDDTVRARAIDVTTSNHIVTLRGSVGSEAEHARALQLARETNGVTRVVDQLTVQR